MTTDNTRRLAHIGDDNAFIARLHDAFKDMHQLHSASSESLARRLHSGLPKLRSGAGYFSAPLQEFAGGALVPTDAPGLANEGSDLAGSEGK